MANKKSLISAARVAMEARDWEGVIQNCDAVLEAFPNDLPPAYYILKARALSRSGQTEQALQITEEAVSQDVPNVQLWLRWIAHTYRTRDWAEMVRRAEAMCQRFPQERRANLFGALGCFKAEDLQKARDFLAPLCGLHDTDEDLVLAALPLTHGDALAEDFRARWKSVAQQQGALAGLQHLRNLLLQDRKALSTGEGTLPKVFPWIANLVPGILAAGLNAALRKAASAQLDLPIDPDAFPKRPIIICAYMTEATPSPHMRFINGFAAALATFDAVEAVTILVTQELEPEYRRASTVDAGPFDKERYAGWRNDIEFIAGSYAAKVKIIAIEQDGPIFPQQQALAQAEQECPDMLFTILGILESPVVARVLAKKLPTIAIQSSMSNDIPDFADIVMAHGAREDLSAPGMERCRCYRIPVFPFERREDMDAAELGPPVDIRIVSALSGGRLNAVVRHGLPDRLFMTDFLQKNPHVGWTLIGSADVDHSRALLAEGPGDGLAGRLSVCGFVSDIRAAFAHCAVYVQPSSNPGGAMGIAMALAEGVPIIAPHSCDAAIFLPKDQLVDDPQSVFDRLQELVGNPTARRELAETQMTYMQNNHTIHACAQDMSAFMRDAQASFRARMC